MNRTNTQLRFIARLVSTSWCAVLLLAVASSPSVAQDTDDLDQAGKTQVELKVDSVTLDRRVANGRESFALFKSSDVSRSAARDAEIDELKKRIRELQTTLADRASRGDIATETATVTLVPIAKGQNGGGRLLLNAFDRLERGESRVQIVSINQHGVVRWKPLAKSGDKEASKVTVAAPRTRMLDQAMSVALSGTVPTGQDQSEETEDQESQADEGATVESPSENNVRVADPINTESLRAVERMQRMEALEMLIEAVSDPTPASSNKQQRSAWGNPGSEPNATSSGIELKNISKLVFQQPSALWESVYFLRDDKLSHWVKLGNLTGYEWQKGTTIHLTESSSDGSQVAFGEIQLAEGQALGQSQFTFLHFEDIEVAKTLQFDVGSGKHPTEVLTVEKDGPLPDGEFRRNDEILAISFSKKRFLGGLDRTTTIKPSGNSDGGTIVGLAGGVYTIRHERRRTVEVKPQVEVLLRQPADPSSWELVDAESKGWRLNRSQTHYEFAVAAGGKIPELVESASETVELALSSEADRKALAKFLAKNGDELLRLLLENATAIAKNETRLEKLEAKIARLQEEYENYDIDQSPAGQESNRSARAALRQSVLSLRKKHSDLAQSTRLLKYHQDSQHIPTNYETGDQVPPPPTRVDLTLAW